MDFWLERALNEVDGAIAGLSLQQMAWRPAEGKWCAADILEHLSMTYEKTCHGLDKVIRTGKPIAHPGTFMHWLSVRVVNDLGYFPTGRPAPEFAVPTGKPGEQAVQAIREHLAAMDRALSQIEQKLGAKVKVADHFAVGPMSVAEWRKFHYRHTHHHVKQLLTLRRRVPTSFAADQRG